MQRSNVRMTRRLLPAFLLAASGLFAVFTAGTAAADAPPQKSGQVPGYYRMMLGRFEVTALNDGYVMLPEKLLKDASKRSIDRLLARGFVDASHGMQTAVNGFLVNTGQQLVLVDAGGGKCLGPSAGHLIDNLQAAGYRPEQVDAVLITHLHRDHTCGLLADGGKPAFPNATVYVSKKDAAYWLDKDTMAKAPADKQAGFKVVQDAVAPYVAAGKLKQFDEGQALMPGITVEGEPGHTPGHTGYLFSSDGSQLLAWGDIVHSRAVQFARPQVAIDFDSSQQQAIATRRQILADAAQKKTWIAGAHLPFPGIGHVRADVRGYGWVPVMYAPLPVH